MRRPRSVHKRKVHTVGVREFRAGLASWLDRARAGEQIIVTERGRPVARLVPERGERQHSDLVERMRGTGTTGMTTDQIMALTRDV